MPGNSPDVSNYRDANRTIVAYHGTTAEVADRLVDGKAFVPSRTGYEWLGTGMYFWEYASEQAWWWARDLKRHPEPAVVGALIRLGNCLDLLDPANVRWLKGVHDDIIPQWQLAGRHVPANVRNRKGLDCVILNWVYERSDAKGEPIETCRGVYVPNSRSKRAWKGSWIHEDAHIQICVRSQRNILGLWHVRHDGSYGKD